MESGTTILSSLLLLMCLLLLPHDLGVRVFGLLPGLAVVVSLALLVCISLPGSFSINVSLVPSGH